MATVLETTTRIIAEKAEMDPQDLKADSILADLDIQSLELAEIIFDLEDEYDIEIELNAATAWQKLKTVQNVADAVAELAGQSA
jgi:nodulation protein F